MVLDCNGSLAESTVAAANLSEEWNKGEEILTAAEAFMVEPMSGRNPQSKRRNNDAEAERLAVSRALADLADPTKRMAFLAYLNGALIPKTKRAQINKRLAKKGCAPAVAYVNNYDVCIRSFHILKALLQRWPESFNAQSFFAVYSMEIIVCGDSWESFELLERIKSKRTSLRRLIERYEATWEFHRSEKDGSVNMGTWNEITKAHRLVTELESEAVTARLSKFFMRAEVAVASTGAADAQVAVSNTCQKLQPQVSPGMTPKKKAVVRSNPSAPTPLPQLKCKIGSEVELYNLVGTLKGWNGRRGVVVGQHLTMHTQNTNIQSWALEIACDPPISKTVFFSDKVRLVRDRKRQNKIKPNSPCPCVSGKKYKKYCHKKNATTEAADRTEAREQNRDRSLAAKPASTKSQRQKRAASISDV